MSPIHVLFAIGSMEVGGAETQVVRYLKQLDRSRFAPGLYLTARRGELLAEVPRDVPIFAFDERVSPGKRYVPGGIHRRQVKDFVSVIREFNAGLVVSRSVHLTLIAAPAARRCSVPFIAIDASHPQLDFRRNAGRFQMIKRWLISRAYARAAAVIALSEGAAQGIADFYHLPRSRVSMLSSSIDVEELTRLAAEPSQELEPDCFHVVTVGRLVPEKGHRDLIEAVARLIKDAKVPNLRLHLIGDGPLRVDLERAARASGIGDAVRFAGFQRNPFSTMRQCDVFCLPSLYEGSPGALLEAMACGVPVVASDCESGPREILCDGRFGTLVPVHDPQSLANAIQNVAQNLQSAREKAAEAQRSVEQRYSTKVVVGRIETLFEEILNSGSDRAQKT